MGSRMKKGVIVLSMAFLYILCCAGTSKAATFTKEYLLEQARGKAPDVKAFIVGSRVNSKTTFSGELGGKFPLKQEENLKAFEKTGEGIRYVILMDNSGSVDPKQLSAAKGQLQALRKNLRNGDEMELYTVGRFDSEGSKINVLGRTVKGKEKSKLKQDIKKIGKIRFLKSAKSRTVLYRSLRETIEANKAPAQRTVILLVTDGEDDSTGKNNDKEIIRKSVAESDVPVYSVFLKNKARKPNKVKMRYTKYKILDEGNCRGYCADCSGAKKVKQAFSELNQIWKKKTFVVTMTAPNNKIIEGGAKLVLSVQDGDGGPTLNPLVINYTDSEPDTEPPVISDIKKTKSNAITFKITDNSGGAIIGANDPANYVVKEKTDSEEGKNWPVNSANYNEVDKTVILTFKDDLYTGDYELICSNIHDDTNEQNMISGSSTFSFEGLDGAAERRKQLIRSYWWVLLIVLVVVIGLIALIIIKKKPGKIVEINPDDLLKADSKLIRLTITDRVGTIKDVEWNVEGSLFVGRSDICNIYFDDERLSKQHFVIEVTKMACYIEDLESTNGTFVNGVKISNRRMLLDGDIITAGREKFEFHSVQGDEGNEQPEQ